MFVERHHDAGTVVPASNMTPTVLPVDVQRLITGHRDIKEVQKYVEAANQKKLAKDGINLTYGAA